MSCDHWSIGLLGGFRLTWGEETCGATDHGVVPARLQALLAYLILHRQQPQLRAHLAFLFWPDTSEAQALTNLRNLLHKLRHFLPHPDKFLQFDHRSIQWRTDAPCTIDVIDFEAALANATTVPDLAHAVDLYHGELLPGCYDDWIMPERERLRQLALSALDRLIDQLEVARDYRTAIRYGQRQLQLEPLNEAIYRRLMRLHAVDNDRAGAFYLYARCEAMLHEEFGAEPSLTTQELYQRLQHHDLSPPTQSTAPADQPPLVGRTDEWSQLVDSWYRASSGQSHCLLLTGEAGIGKTRLAGELLLWVARQGFPAAMAHCYGVEGGLAYAPVVEWLRSPPLYAQLPTLADPWLTEVARLLPELLTSRPHLTPPGPLNASWQRQRFFEALARALLEGERPLLLLIDDLQWCDRDTLAWLHYLLRVGREGGGGGSPLAPFSKRPLLLVGTVRSEALDERHPLHELVGALHHDDALTELPLTGLTPAETTDLANSVAGHPFTPRQSEQIYRETEGNPLFVVEMVRAGLAQGDVAWPDGAAPGDAVVGTAFAFPDQGALPPKVHAVIHTRLAELSAPARTVAGLAATIGRAFSYAVLAHACRTDDDTLVDGLDELCQRRIVRERSADLYDFTHDKLREVTYNSLSAARRRLAHRSVAQALETVVLNDGNGVPAQSAELISGQIAYHYELAGINEKAIAYYQQAATAAHQISANDDAVRAYQRALALARSSTTHTAARVIQLHEQLGDLLIATGQYEEARTNFAQALAHVTTADPIACATLHRKIGSTWREQYGYAQAMQFYNAALRALYNPPGSAYTGNAQADSAPGQPSAMTADALSGAAPIHASHPPAWWEEWLQLQLEIDLVHYWLAETAESMRLQQEIQPLVEQYGTAGQRATFFQRRTQLELRRHRSIATAEAVAYARRSLALYTAAAMGESLPAAHFMLGFTLLWHDDLAEAAAELEEALRHATQTGDRSLQARALTYLTIVARRGEQVARAATLAGEALAVATAAHMPEYVALARANQAWLAWRKRDLAAVREDAHAAQALWQQLPVTHASAPFQWTALWPLIAAALATDDPATALDAVHQLLDPHQQQLPAAVEAPLTSALQAEADGNRNAAMAEIQAALCAAQKLHYL